MRVRYFTNIPSPYRINFFNELGKKCDLEVVFEAEKAPKINNDWYKDNKIKNFKSIFLKKGIIEEQKINFKILKYVTKKCDVLVFTNYSYYTEMLALIYAKILRKKYVLMIDGGIISTNEMFLKRALKKFLISNALSYFSPSKSTDDFLEYYGAEKDRINRYPFTSLYKDEIIKEPIASSEKIRLRNEMSIKESKVILSIGQFIQRKGFDWMIKAYKDLDKDIGIYIIGGEPTKEYINLKEKYHLTNLHFIEFQNKNTILKWYKLADLFVLPTREDIWGLVINEAMSQGLPIITTNKCVAGLELVKNGNNGFLVNVEGYDDLLNKTKYIFFNEENRYQMSLSSLEIIKKYSIENMSNLTFDFILSLSMINKVKKYEV